MKRGNTRLKKKIAEEEIKKKKMKGTLNKARDDQVIDHHLANDARKKMTSKSYNDSRGMQDKNFTYSQNLGQSQGQSNRGQPDAKRTKGEFRPDPVGTAQNNYSDLQGPQWGKPKGKKGPICTLIL